MSVKRNGGIEVNPILYVTQVPVTPTPVPTPTVEMVTQWYIGGVGPLSNGYMFLIGGVIVLIIIFALIIFDPLEVY
jgi:hypothetical protein